MQIRGPAKGTTRARGPASAAPLPSGTVRRHVLLGAAITALGGLPGLSIVALTYFQRQVPETKNRSLQDIERDLDLPESHDDLHHRPVSRTRS